MKELSLNVLDIAENSIEAGASLIKIAITIKGDLMSIVIEDNGRGMSEEELRVVDSPFFTTRSTRKVGMGVPLFKRVAENTGGNFSISSTKGLGTKVFAEFKLNSEDRLPLGDISATMCALLSEPEIEYEFSYSIDDQSYEFKTVEYKRERGYDRLDLPETLLLIREEIKMNIYNINGGLNI